MRVRLIFPSSARMKDLSLWSDVFEYASRKRSAYSLTLGKLPNESRLLAGTSLSVEPDLTLAFPKFPVTAPDVRRAGFVLLKLVDSMFLFYWSSVMINFSLIENEWSINGILI